MASGIAFVHVYISVGVVEVAVWCKRHMCEILVEGTPYFMAVRPRSACFQVYVLRAFVSIVGSFNRASCCSVCLVA